MSETSLHEEAIEHLRKLGFTNTEAEAYIALLQNSPATGYRIATEIGKATANTYKALRTLVQKGAVLSQEGKGKLFRAVPIEELLHRFTHEFETQRDSAMKVLQKLDTSTQDIGIYQLTTSEQVLQRAKEMINQAQEMILITAFPGPLLALLPEIENAAKRGVDIGVKGYKEIEITGAEFILSTESDLWLDQMPGEELSMMVDTQEHLIALLDGEDVLQAIWSASPFLAFIHHNSLATEHQITRLARKIYQKTQYKPLYALLKPKRYPIGTSGHQKLCQFREQRKKTDS